MQDNRKTKAQLLAELATLRSRMAALEEGASERLDLQQAGIFFDAIVDQIPNMIFVKDARELKFVHMNKAGEALLGYRRDELIGKSDYDFFPSEQADFFTAKDRRVLAEGQLEDIPEEPIHTRHKGLRILHTKKIPLSDAVGRPQYLLGISEDITLRKQTEQALQQAERLASLGTLAAGIAHELNNPLGAMMVTAEHARHALSELDIPKGIRECLDDILKDARRCAQTVKRTLQFARQGYPMRTVVDLHTIIKSACHLTRGYAKQHDVQLDLTLAPVALPIRANVEEMELALVNLIRNAVEAGQCGAQVHLRTEVKAMQVSITVEDTGTGLTEADQQNAFDPFYTTRQHAGGTGLGLSITHRIITNHQGTIDLCSRPGQGTIVRIRLPSAV